MNKYKVVFVGNGQVVLGSSLGLEDFTRDFFKSDVFLVPNNDGIAIYVKNVAYLERMP